MELGKTSTGKIVHDSFDHPEHQGFTEKEHKEAAQLNLQFLVNQPDSEDPGPLSKKKDFLPEFAPPAFTPDLAKYQTNYAKHFDAWYKLFRQRDPDSDMDEDMPSPSHNRWISEEEAKKLNRRTLH